MEVTSEKYVEVLASLKPINTLKYVFDFIFNSPTVGLKAANLVALLEVHGFFWEAGKEMLLVVADVLQSIFSSCSGVKDALLKYFSTTEQESGIEEQAVDVLPEGLIYKCMSFLQDSGLDPAVVLSLRGVVPVFVAGAVAIAAIWGGGKLAVSALSLTALGSLRSIAQEMRDMKTIGQSFHEVWTSIMAFLGPILGFSYRNKDELEKAQMLEEIQKLETDLNALTQETKIWFPRVMRDRSFFRRYRDQVARHEKLLVSMCKSNQAMIPLHKYLAEVKKMIDEQEIRYDNLRQTIVGKQTPTTVYLYGAPGVGKSVAIGELVEHLSAVEGRQLSVYSKGKTDKYWSGYAGQDICIFDDFGSNKDDEDHGLLMDIYTPTANQLNMADLPSKGTPFCSRYLLIASNIGHFARSATLAVPEALNRRRDFLFYVRNTLQRVDNKREALFGLRLQAIDKYHVGNPCHDRGYTGDELRDLAEVVHRHQEEKFAEHMNRVEKELTRLTQEEFQEQGETSPGVTIQRLSRQKIFILCGDPGTGKTTLARMFRDDPFQDEAFVDDATGEQTRQRILHAYDDPQELLVFTTNNTDWDNYSRKLSLEQRSAILRRVIWIDFVFRKKNLFKRYTHEDVKAKKKEYHEMVSMRIGGDHYTFGDVKKMIEEARDASPTEVVTTWNSAPIIGVPPKPDFTVTCNMQWQELYGMKLAEWKSRSTIEGASMAQILIKFLPLIPTFNKIEFDKAITEDAIATTINNYRLKADGPTDIVVRFSNAIWYITTDEEDRYVVCKSKQDISYKFEDGTMYCCCGSQQKWKTTDPLIIELYKSIVQKPKDTRNIVKESVERYGCFLGALPEYATTISAFVKTGIAVATVSALCTRRSSGVVAPSQEPESKRILNPYGLDRKIPIPSMETQPDYKDGMRNPKHQKVEFKTNVTYKKPSWITKLNKTHEDVIAWTKDFAAKGGVLWADMIDDESTKPIKHEALTDPASEVVTTILIEQNFAVMKDNQEVCRAQMIHGKVGVTVGHIAAPDLKLKIGSEQFPMEGLRIHEERDIYIFEVPTLKREFRDVRKHLNRMGKNTSLAGMQACLTVMRGVRPREKNVVLRPVMRFTCTGSDVLKIGMPYGVSAFVDEYQLDQCVGTQSGDCGSPVVVVNANIPKKFIGVHMAGSMTYGYCNLLFREDFGDAIEEESATLVVLPFQAILDPKDVTEVPPPTCVFNVVGRAGEYTEQGIVKHKLLRTRQTRFYKSPFSWDRYPCIYEPAPLDSRDPRIETDECPYLKAICKWNNPQPKVDEVVLDECVEELGGYLAHACRQANIPIKVLTKKESINSYSLIPESAPIWRKSSPGYPETQWPGMHGKKKAEYFDWNEKEQIYSINPEKGKRLHLAIDELLQACQRGEKTAVVFAGSLKDEAIKISKVKEAGSRSFAGSPTYFTIAHRMYCHAASALISHVHGLIPIKVGINPSSQQWEELYKYMSRTGTTGFDADYKAFDATVPAVFMSKIHKIWNAIYQECDPNWKPEHDVIREGLYRHLICPLITFDDWIVETPGGQVSGQPATTVDNCFVNMLYYMYCWRKIMIREKPEWAHFHFFWEKVTFAVYGDDNICTVLDDARKYFNFLSFAKELSLIGLTITPADKTSDGGQDVELIDMSFLKRHFKTLNGRIVGPLEPHSIGKILGVCQRSKRHIFQRDEPVSYDVETIAQTCRPALQEMSLFGEKEYVLLKRHLITVCTKEGIPMPYFPSWKEMFRETYYAERTWVQTFTREKAISQNCLECNSEIFKCSCTRMESNGGNNPPMPSSSGQTGAVFNGTDETPIPLSAIATAPAPTVAEASPHAGVINTIDPYFYSQFVSLTTFTWTINQAPGTLLFSTPISPKHAHANLRYLSRLYNIWVGGLDYQIKVAGTGFHAGAIAVVRLPPNIDPASITGSSQFTMFEYIVIDPKNLDALSKSVCDQRPVMYHYMSDPDTSPTAIGGHLAIYVLMQLNTSSTGTNQIDIQVFNKASMDFALLQIVPTTLDNTPVVNEAIWRELFEFKKLHFNPYTQIPVKTLVAKANFVGNAALAGVTNTNTGLMRPYVGFPQTDGYVGQMKCVRSTASNSTFQVIDEAGNPIKPDQKIGPTDGVKSLIFWTLPQDVNAHMDFIDWRLDQEIVVPFGDLTPGDVIKFFITTATTSKTISNSTDKWFPPVDETIVVFESQGWNASALAGQDLTVSAHSGYCGTTAMLGELFATRRYLMPPGQAALLQIYDREYNAPLMYVKLYKEGLFTTSKRSVDVVLEFSKIAINYVGWIRETDPMPGPSQSMAMAVVTRTLENRLERDAKERSEFNSIKAQTEAAWRRALIVEEKLRATTFFDKDGNPMDYDEIDFDRTEIEEQGKKARNKQRSIALSGTHPKPAVLKNEEGLNELFDPFIRSLQAEKKVENTEERNEKVSNIEKAEQQPVPKFRSAHWGKDENGRNIWLPCKRCEGTPVDDEATSYRLDFENWLETLTDPEDREWAKRQQQLDDWKENVERVRRLLTVPHEPDSGSSGRQFRAPDLSDDSSDEDEPDGELPDYWPEYLAALAEEDHEEDEDFWQEYQEFEHRREEREYEARYGPPLIIAGRPPQKPHLGG